MSLFSPQSDYFKMAVKINNFSNTLFWIIFALSILFTLSDSSICINAVSILSLIMLFFLDMLTKYYQCKGDFNRRKDFIDNSFGTKFSIKSSISYYDNEEINQGLLKALVNVFENSFFSLNVTNEMKKQALFKNTIMFIIVIACAFYGFSNNSLALPILQLFLSKYFVEDMLILYKYNSKVESIFNNITNMFSNELFNNKLNVNLVHANIIHMLIEYEVNIANSNIFLDSKIFNRLNTELTNEWSIIKKKYGIV